MRNSKILKKPDLNSLLKKMKLYSLFIITLGMLVMCGCVSSPSKPPKIDPLEGFNARFDPKWPQDIENDCQNYIKGLSPEEQSHMAYDEYFGNSLGQHAVKITIGLHGTDWWHVLIYDKDNKRIKTIKYISGHSQS